MPTTDKEIIIKLAGGLIVSCQAFDYEPLYGEETIAKLAKAAEIGGAVAIRANGPSNIRAIKKNVALPIMGINKIIPPDYDKIRDAIITPSLAAATEIICEGIDIIAVDCTLRNNRQEKDIKCLIDSIREVTSVPIMGEISTLEEGILVENIGCDIVSTTIAGYTPYSRHIEEPDYKLVGELVNHLSIPVNAEGRYNTPESVGIALKIGAWAVTVGSAITRPQFITKSFVKATKGIVR